MLEGLAAFIAVALLLWAFSDGGDNNTPQYTIEQHRSGRFYEVIDESGQVVFAGTKADCEQWVDEKH